MSLENHSDLRKLIKSNVEKQVDTISPLHANTDSLKIVEKLIVTEDTTDHVLQFFNTQILPDYAKNVTRVLKKNNKEQQFIRLMACLYFASGTKPLSVSRNVNIYSTNEYFIFTKFLIFLFDWLENNEYLVQKKGYHFGDLNGRRWTRISPTLRLKRELLKYIKVKSVPGRDKNLIVLRDSEGKSINYKPNKFTKNLKTSIAAINLCNSKHSISVYRRRKELSIIPDLHVVFNEGSFEKGGRFYSGGFGGYQSLPKSDRATILINGNRTIELDYSGLHPRLLYALKGFQFDEDPYKIVISVDELRPVLKKVLLTIFNTETKVQAIQAGNNEMLNNPKMMKLLKQYKLTIKEIVNMFIDEHSAIADYFFVKMGITLMNIDSQIARKVLENITTRGEACLCVHDSFIVDTKNADLLRHVMQDAYGEISEFYSSDKRRYFCPIKC